MTQALVQNNFFQKYKNLNSIPSKWTRNRPIAGNWSKNHGDNGNSFWWKNWDFHVLEVPWKMKLFQLQSIWKKHFRICVMHFFLPKNIFSFLRPLEVLSSEKTCVTPLQAGFGIWFFMCFFLSLFLFSYWGYKFSALYFPRRSKFKWPMS